MEKKMKSAPIKLCKKKKPTKISLTGNQKKKEFPFCFRYKKKKRVKMDEKSFW